MQTATNNNPGIRETMLPAMSRYGQPFIAMDATKTIHPIAVQLATRYTRYRLHDLERANPIAAPKHGTAHSRNQALAETASHNVYAP
jgi:hypothetical protein